MEVVEREEKNSGRLLGRECQPGQFERPCDAETTAIYYSEPIRVPGSPGPGRQPVRRPGARRGQEPTRPDQPVARVVVDRRTRLRAALPRDDVSDDVSADAVFSWLAYGRQSCLPTYSDVAAAVFVSAEQKPISVMSVGLDRLKLVC